MLMCEGYEMFEGIIKVTPKNIMPAYEVEGVVLYRPDTKTYYVNGASYPAELVEVVKDNSPVDYDKYHREIEFHSNDEYIHMNIKASEVPDMINKYAYSSYNLINDENYAKDIKPNSYLIYAVKTYLEPIGTENNKIVRLHTYVKPVVYTEAQYKKAVKDYPRMEILYWKL